VRAAGFLGLATWTEQDSARGVLFQPHPWLLSVGELDARLLGSLSKEG